MQGILFDNDGTLVDTYDLILSSMCHATKAVLRSELPEAELMAKVGIPLYDQMLLLAEGDPALAQELTDVYRAHNHAHHDQVVCVFPGVAEGLVRLQEAGIRLGVVTAKRHALAQRGLEVAGVWSFFDCLVGPDDCPRAKPDPDPILFGAELLGVPAQDCWYVGDSPFDMQAGNAAGCTTVAALWGMFAPDVLVAESPDLACATFSDMVDLALS